MSLAHSPRRSAVCRRPLGQAQHSVTNSSHASSAHELEQTLSELQASNSSRQQLNDTILGALSSPILPVRQGVIVLPLVGLIDDQRAALPTDTRCWQAIERQRAHTLIIDITGVPLVDTHVAGALIQAASAALLGWAPKRCWSGCVRTGPDNCRPGDRSLTPDLARDLESGIRYADSRAH